MATVELTPEAIQQADRLPAVVLKRFRKILNRLKDWPAVSGAKSLSGDLAGWYRMRTGDYRLCVRVQGEMIYVDKIEHRKDFHEDR